MRESVVLNSILSCISLLITVQELHAIEEELHMEILPGTEIMADIGSHHFVKGAGNDNVLVPQPSDDPHDVRESLLRCL